MDMSAWMARVTTDLPTVIARRIGMSTSTFHSQINRDTGLKPETVVMIARAYGADPLEGLVALGLITPEEAGS